jgi:diacylglycerol kinase family enzyme
MTHVAGVRGSPPPRSKTKPRRIEILVNPRSGGVGPKAAQECETLLESLDVDAHIVELDPRRMDAMIAAALDAKPDVLVVLAGDGTARAVAGKAGPTGPLIAPLPGGTMNLLPHALYGDVDWKKALELALTQGVARSVAGGDVGGKPFYVAAILGSPALWAPAREAMRTGKLRLAYLYARKAARRAFLGRLRFRLDGRVPGRSDALAVLSPLISKAMNEPVGLEVAQIDFNNAGEAFVLAAKTLFADWRADPAVEVTVAQRVQVWAQRSIPVILDGEPTEVGRDTEVRFTPCAFMALAPPRDAPETDTQTPPQKGAAG